MPSYRILNLLSVAWLCIRKDLSTSNKNQRTCLNYSDLFVLYWKRSGRIYAYGVRMLFNLCPGCLILCCHLTKCFLQRLVADPDWGGVNNSGEEPMYLSGWGIFHRAGTCHKLFICSSPRESVVLQPHSCHLQHRTRVRAGASGCVYLSQWGEAACRGGDGLGRYGKQEWGGGAGAGPGVWGGWGGRAGLFHAVWWRRIRAAQHDGIPRGRWDVQYPVAA